MKKYSPFLLTLILFGQAWTWTDKKTDFLYYQSGDDVLMQSPGMFKLLDVDTLPKFMIYLDSLCKMGTSECFQKVYLGECREKQILELMSNIKPVSKSILVCRLPKSKAMRVIFADNSTATKEVEKATKLQFKESNADSNYISEMVKSMKKDGNVIIPYPTK